MHFQPSLPRLPIPSLEETCQRYLNAQLPLLDSNNFENTKKLVSNFQSEVGKGKSCSFYFYLHVDRSTITLHPIFIIFTWQISELNQKLIAQDKANKHTSYITEPWFDMYLKDRQPIVLNYNPFISYVDDPKSHYNDQVIRASNFLISAIRYWLIWKYLKLSNFKIVLFYMAYKDSEKHWKLEFLNLKSTTWTPKKVIRKCFAKLSAWFRPHCPGTEPTCTKYVFIQHLIHVNQ